MVYMDDRCQSTVYKDILMTLTLNNFCVSYQEPDHFFPWNNLFALLVFQNIQRCLSFSKL